MGFRQEVETDRNGEFSVRLPLYVSKHLNRIKGCSIKLVKSNDPYCAVASTATSSSIRLKAGKNHHGGGHIFSAGFFTFKPLNQPTLCSQKPTDQFQSKFDTNFPPPLQDPPVPFLSPLLDPILPNLPPLLGNLPPLPLLPPLTLTDKKIANTNSLPDFSNPLPQIPLLPSPPASLFPSNPFSSSPPPLINIPPLIPGLLPSSPPTFPLPSIPSLPFQPSPGFPRIPLPSSSSSSPSSSTSSP